MRKLLQDFSHYALVSMHRPKIAMRTSFRLGLAYISTLTCTKPEPGIFRKSQMTSEEVIELTRGVVLFR